MLSAAQLVNLACCETEDGFPGLLGSFPSRETFQGRPLPPPRMAPNPKRGLGDHEHAAQIWRPETDQRTLLSSRGGG